MTKEGSDLSVLRKSHEMNEAFPQRSWIMLASSPHISGSFVKLFKYFNCFLYLLITFMWVAFLGTTLYLSNFLGRTSRTKTKNIVRFSVMAVIICQMLEICFYVSISVKVALKMAILATYRPLQTGMNYYSIHIQWNSRYLHLIKLETMYEHLFMNFDNGFFKMVAMATVCTLYITKCRYGIQWSWKCGHRQLVYNYTISDAYINIVIYTYYRITVMVASKWLLWQPGCDFTMTPYLKFIRVA